MYPNGYLVFGGENIKVLVVEADKCIGCRICELACSYLHTKEFSPKKSRIKILERRGLGVFIPVIDVSCKANENCNKCIISCPTKALKIVEPGDAAIIRKESKIGSFPIPMVRLKYLR